MKITAAEALPYLFDRIELMDGGSLVTRLSGGEAANLCRLGYVTGTMSARRDEEGKKVPVLRCLSLSVTQRKLKGVLHRLSVKSINLTAMDSKTTRQTQFGVFHDNRKCDAYFGGPSRLEVII